MVLGLAAVIFTALHARTVPATLEDEDSVNLALGVEHFDVRRYAPHPPGYPVYIALAKTSTAAVGALRPDWPRDRRAAAGLSWLSILAGSLGLFALAAWWRAFGVAPWWAVGAAVATAASPLYWFTAARPLTDTPGLVAAVAVQAAVLHTLWGPHVADVRRWLITGAIAGLVIGLRSQTMWLTLPLLAVAGIILLRRRPAAALMLPLGGLLGVLAWAVPLVLLSGGLGEYLNVLRGQGQHDFEAVAMLWTHPSWALLREDLQQTFLNPWHLARWPWVVAALAAGGAAVLVRADRTKAAWLLVLTLPYLVFHLLFHEVETIRYALPTVVVVAGLATLSLRLLGRAGGAVLAGLSVAGVVIIQPVTTAYAAGAPVFLALNDIRHRAEQARVTPRLEAHHNAWWAASRAIDWARVEWPIASPRLIRTGESLRLVEYWRSGGSDPIWFLSDPTRDDLMRFGREAAVHHATYRLPSDVAPLIAGLRTYEVGWWTIDRPDWMLGKGWAIGRSLTDEARTPGVAGAFLRRRPEATMLFIGARRDTADSTQAEVVARIDGVDVDRWSVPAGNRMTRWIALPGGFLDGDTPYAELTLHVDADAQGRSDVVFDQFDAASDAPLVALGHGWNVDDEAPPGEFWRRTERLSELEVRHTGSPVQVSIRGNGEPGEFVSAPVVVITAGSTLLAQFVADDQFEQTFEVAPDVLDRTNGTLTIAVDARTTAAERARGTGKPKRGLRVRKIGVTPAKPASR